MAIDKKAPTSNTLSVNSVRSNQVALHCLLLIWAMIGLRPGEAMTLRNMNMGTATLQGNHKKKRPRKRYRR